MSEHTPKASGAEQVQEMHKLDGGDWKSDPSADERWNAGCDFAMLQLCTAVGVDPHMVSWDAATETVDGDVQAVIGNILRARDEATPAPVMPVGRERLRLFLAILQGAGGETSGNDETWNWINYFCDDGWPLDTFNQASKEGLTRVTHDSDTDNSVVYLTDAGKAFIALVPIAEKGEDWLPISTAPKVDGYYMVANDRGQVCPLQRSQGHGIVQNMVGVADWDYGSTATHWRPLPAPPLSHQSKEA